MAEPILTARGLTKRYGRVTALDAASELGDGGFFAAVCTPNVAQQALTGFAGY